MAKQVQYRGAARARGFSPQQVSDAAISRMREDSNRTLQGMREAARADIEQRQRISTEVKANQQYEKGAREKNFQIQTQNQQTQLRQTQLDSQTALEQLEIDQAAQTKIFENVANLSQTAAKKYEEIQKVKSDERAQQALNEFDLDPTSDPVIQQLLGEYELAATEEVRQSELDVAQAKGGPRLAISKARSLDSNGRYKLDQARSNYILTNIYPQQLNKALLDAGDLDSAQTAAFIATFKRDFIQKSGILNLKPAMIRDGLVAVNKVNQGIHTKAQNREIKMRQGIAVDNATTILTQNPSAFNQNIVSSFNTIVRNNGDNYEAAYKWLEGLATQRGVNGEYLFTLDQIANATVNKGQPFALSNPGRMGAIKMARERGDTQYRSAQIQADDLRYKEDEKRFLQGLTQDNSKEFAEEALLFFQETYGKVPQSIQKFANSYTYDAVAKAKRIEELEAIPDGFIKNEDVDALSFLDPTAGRALAERKVAQDRKYTTGVFKDQNDSFKTVANGVTSFGSNKPNTPASVFLQGRMRAEYRKRVDQAVAGGMDFNTAATTIGMQLADEVKNGARDPQSLWYRKPNQAGGSSEFPNLNKGNLPALEKANRRYAALKKDIYDRGLPAVLQTPESIITKEEAVSIINGYGKPGFTIPLDVVAVAGMSNGADPFTIINAQLEALDLDPLDPPQIIKDVRSQMTPESSALLFDARAREQARIRAVQQGVSQTSGDTSAFRQPMRMRAGSTFRRTSSNNTIENILSNLTDADWDELGYVVSSEAARNTNDEFGVAASVLTRLASGKYGTSIGEIIRAPGQYEAVYKGMARYEPSLSSKLKSAEGREKIRNFFMQLDGRTDFKGQTMLKNRVASEDPMFAPTGNFYHYAGQ